MVIVVDCVHTMLFTFFKFVLINWQIVSIGVCLISRFHTVEEIVIFDQVFTQILGACNELGQPISEQVFIIVIEKL